MSSLILAIIAVLTPRILLAQAEKPDLLIYVFGPYNNLKAGQDNILSVEVRNVGNGEITDVRLFSEKPEGWVIEFRPAEIDRLVAGSIRTVEVNVKPATGTAEGEYRVTLIAEANETRKDTSIGVTIEPSVSVWLWVGTGLAVIVVISFIIVFRRLSRH